MNETRFVMVSEWMSKSDIKWFLKANPNANRLGLVRFLLEVLYLHLSLTMT